MEKNVLGTELAPCSENPLTGYLRDGCCNSVPEDTGRHEVCAVMTDEFLEFSRERGNDLVTPRPTLAFPGLEPGDRWCVCLGRWVKPWRTELRHRSCWKRQTSPFSKTSDNLHFHIPATERHIQCE